MPFPWAHQSAAAATLPSAPNPHPSIYLSIYFCLQNVRLFAWDQGTSECSEAELGQELPGQPGYKQGERAQHSTSGAKLRYGAEREQYLQEDNCFMEMKLLQKPQLYIDSQPLPCCGLCSSMPISTKSQTEREFRIYIEISSRLWRFAVGAAGERWNRWANSAIADALC